MGNCGVTFAPVRPEHKERLAEMMESVEDIPRDAILTGLPWDWNSYGEYLDSIEQFSPAINLSGLVGHCAARFYVMGERAVDEQPTPAEIEQIAAVVGQSVKDGAVGFSSSRLHMHKLPDGRCVPGTFAAEDELTAISKAVGSNGGFLQYVLNYSRLDDEMALLKSQLSAAGTRLLFSSSWQPCEGVSNAYQSAIDDMRASGMDVTGLCQPRSVAFLSGLKTGRSGYRTPAWNELWKMNFEERLAAVRNSDFRNRLIDEARNATENAPDMFWLGNEEQPTYMRPAAESLADLARAAGEHPAETWIRFMLESNVEALFQLKLLDMDIEELPGFLKSDWVLPGVGDAGAHVTQIMDSGWATFFLSYWHRERGIFTLEESIRLLTSAPARVLGCSDRGSLIVGQKADINLIDVDRVAERQPQLVHDFPGGAPRLIQRAVGYRNTIVNGVVILENDELTGARGGQVLRNTSAA